MSAGWAEAVTQDVPYEHIIDKSREKTAAGDRSANAGGEVADSPRRRWDGGGASSVSADEPEGVRRARRARSMKLAYLYVGIDPRTTSEHLSASG